MLQGATLGSREASGQPHVSLATAPITPRQTRLAFSIIAVIFLAFAVIGSVRGYAAATAYMLSFRVIAALIFVTDFITAVLLFTQFWMIRTVALLILANGYLFTALIVIPHALSFPGAFAPTGLFDSLQSTIWLYNIWHYSFTAFVLAYAALKDRAIYVNKHSLASAIAWSAVTVVLLVSALAWVVSNADTIFPNLSLDAIRHGTVVHYAATINALLNALACLLLWMRRRSSLDLWLTVAVCAGITEPLLTGLLSSARFDFGFYASRAYSVVTSTVVLTVLLSEITRLYTNLSSAFIRAAARAR